MSKTIWDKSLAIEVDIMSDVASDLLLKRGLSSQEARQFVTASYEDGLSDPFILNDMDKAVKRILLAIKEKQQITIYGDYDIDGLSSCALLYDALSQMGSKPALYIPDRFDEGYGLNTKALEKLKAHGADLVITVDCGTTAHKQASEAQKMGLDLIITDHHEPDGEAPKGALACVNPKLTKESKLRDLAGVGVAFYLVRALIQKSKLFKPGQEKWLLDLVALGTICDVVPLVGDNRVLSKNGLKVLKISRRVGIRALASASGVDLSLASETDLGFKLGPRLNAAGRLAHAKKALDLLISTDIKDATKLAQELSELNSKRQEETKTIYAEASEQAKQYKSQPILVLSSPDWSQGVVGIVASRIAEKYHKPTIIIQELGKTAKGSARSFNTFNIVKAIQSCHKILQSFGGHSFAAGLKLDTERIEELRYRIVEYAVANMDVKNNFRTVKVGIQLTGAQASLELCKQIAKLAPFGNSNKKPYCCGVYEVEQIRLVGSDASHLRLLLRDEDNKIHTAIGFGMASNYGWLQKGHNIEVVFELSENIWQDRKTHQLELIDIHPSEHIIDTTKVN